MPTRLDDLGAFLAVARARGFREGARASGVSASRLSDAIRRLETRLGVRLFNRTTRRVVPTQAGQRLLERLEPALGEVENALDSLNDYRDRPTGTLRLNVPGAVARLTLPGIVPAFLAAYPDICLEVVAEENFVDILAAGCDAGIRYEEKLAQDMVAIPIGPRFQRYAAAASPAYLDRHGRPQHPRELLDHACLRGRFPSGHMPPWEFERRGKVLKIEPSGPLIVRAGTSTDLAVEAAVAGTGIVFLFEQWLQPYFDSGALEPVLEPWWQRFSGPFLYYPGRRLVPAPLRAFIDFVKNLDDRGRLKAAATESCPPKTRRKPKPSR